MVRSNYLVNIVIYFSHYFSALRKSYQKRLRYKSPQNTDTINLNDFNMAPSKDLEVEENQEIKEVKRIYWI